MNRQKVLFTPGPTNVPKFVLDELSKDIIHHRMGDYKVLLEQITKKLNKVFNTQEDVLILTSSGTGSMESQIVNLFSKGDKVLVIDTGYFGERYTEISRIYGIEVIELVYPWGTSYNINDVKKAISEHPDLKGIFVTYHETATGVYNDLKPLGELVKDTEILLVTDCISGMIVHPFLFDEWHIDCAAASSQKGFLLPPGLAFIALSKKARERMKSSDLPKYYWDYQRYYDSLYKGQNPFTPAISLVIALDKALDYILDLGIPKIVEDQIALRHYAEERFKELNFELFVEHEAWRGNVLIPIVPKFDINLTKLTSDLDQKYNLSVSKGQGSYTEKMLRVGILGDINKKDIDHLVDTMKRLIEENKK